MRVTLDPRSPTTPSQQIRSQIADQIRGGLLTEGQRLPPIRQLAADLRVAPGTVAKAYALLESDALIETSRARGTRVSPNQAHARQIREAAAAYLRAVEQLDLEQALSAVRAAWEARHGTTS